MESALEDNSEFSQRGVTVLGGAQTAACVLSAVQVNDVRIRPVGTDGRAADVTTEPEQVDVWLPSSLLESLGGPSALVVEAEVGPASAKELARSGTSTARLRGLRNAGTSPLCHGSPWRRWRCKATPLHHSGIPCPRPFNCTWPVHPASYRLRVDPPPSRGHGGLNQEVRKELEALDNVVVLGIIHLRRDERVPGTNIQHRIDQFVIRRADGSVEPVRWKLQDAPSELVEMVLGSE